jgi:iron complex transport system ATP-binding protein
MKKNNDIAIALEDISLTRSGHSILSDINLEVEQGTCCAVIGPNGSGKSALIAVMSGYMWPSQGTVALGGQVYGQVHLAELRKTIGLIEPSRSPKFNKHMSVRHLVATGLFGAVMLPLGVNVMPAQWERVDEEIQAIGLAPVRDAPFGRLSSGECMKALLARALVSHARVLLLDEPTVGLDLGARAACVSVIERLLQRKDGPTVIIVSHHLDELPRSVDQVVLLKQGKIVANGPPAKVLTSPALSMLFDCQAQVYRQNGRFFASTFLE